MAATLADVDALLDKLDTAIAAVATDVKNLLAKIAASGTTDFSNEAARLEGSIGTLTGIDTEVNPPPTPTPAPKPTP